MIILAIDTSCDETSAAVLDGARLVSSRIWSQIKEQREWGGVVPSVARRAHELRLPAVVSSVLARYNSYKNYNRYKQYSPISAVAVTVGPGLAPALEVGVRYAKQLAQQYDVPLIPVNHLEGHIASVFLRNRANVPYSPNSANLPNSFLSLIVSGGHTELALTTLSHSSLFSHVLLGQTLDDAAGECLDKVGRQLGLGYPAGSIVEELARDGDERAIELPIPMQKSSKTDLNFSFSGLKSAALRSLSRLGELSAPQTKDFCASLQRAVAEALVLKLHRAMEMTEIKSVVFVGGVSANNYFRRRFSSEVYKSGGIFVAAPKKFTGDNAAMIGLAAQWTLARGEVAKTKEEIVAIDRLPNLNFLPNPK